MLKCYIIVHGTVQGVFFRHFTKKTATNLDLTGITRNKPDGTVEIIAEGPKENVIEFIELIKKGPEAAEVEKTDVEFEEPTYEHEDFQIVD